MNAKIVGFSIFAKLLIAFIVLNIVGDIGNIIFWYASPSSQSSLNGGYIAGVAGAASALEAGSIILAIVAVIYIISAYGLVKKLVWAPLLVIAISVANRALALVLYEISAAFLFWLVWTVILVVLAAFVYRKMKA